jgi:predicted nucleotidyltransferase component of viral defense system
MIGRTELLSLASELGLEPRVVEKDYLLGWILGGIYRDSDLAASWIFKGGTCLKKCYFETYRFSEDLDFTITDTAQLDQEFLLGHFSELSTWLYNETGIELPVDQLRFDIYDNKRGKRQGEGRLAYRGPIASRGGPLPRIRLDLTADETVVLAPVARRVNHPYSDEPPQGITARCYAFDEVFAEKIRALAERTRPRDLYDVINLFRNGEFGAIASRIRDVVGLKCSSKSVPFPTLTALASSHDELISEWRNMLGHQLPALPPVDSFWSALPEFFQWLMGIATPTPLTSHPGIAGATILRAPAGAIHIASGGTPFIETIRFAAVNRLLVELDYVDENGSRRTRPIEAYSLRRTQDENIILCAVNVEKQASRSYRIDRIRGARVLNSAFVPRYVVELTPTGPLPIPDTARDSLGGGSGWSTAHRSSPRAHASGPTHVFQCTVCGNQFNHKSYDATLRAHKNRSGRDCYGRIGRFVRTKY